MSRLMQSVGRRYVQYFNQYYGRTGTLWEGRQKASLVDAERYLLALYRRADVALVTPIYGSREKPEPGVTSELVVKAARESGHRRAQLCSTLEEAREALREKVQEGDVVLTMGAGDIVRWGQELVRTRDAGEWGA